MKPSENGSVLIEAMVASAMVALMLAAMYQSIGDSAARSHIIAEKRMALLIAQSEMDAVGSTLPLSPGATGGVEGSYNWQIAIQPFAFSQGASKAGPLYQVTVSVKANDRNVPLVTLNSLVLGPAS